jgi:hypothetical protein
MVRAAAKVSQAPANRGGIGPEFRAERQGRRILEMGAAGFYDPAEFLCLDFKRAVPPRPEKAAGESQAASRIAVERRRSSTGSC